MDKIPPTLPAQLIITAIDDNLQDPNENIVIELNNKIKRSDILSPTFNIANEYKIKKITIIHYDLFRLKNENEILQLDIFDNNKNIINIIEWPEIIRTRPKNRIEFFFRYTKKEKYRNIFIKGFGKWKKYKFNEI